MSVAALVGAQFFGLATSGAATSTSTSSPRSVTAPHGGVRPQAAGLLDCNGFSPTQRPLRHDSACTDIRGVNGERAEDNGHYVGHDEPSIRFLSSQPGSANNVWWNETLPKEPAALPTVSQPGRDVTHNFELTIAPWFGMALCNPESYPLLPCVPRSDANAPAAFSPGPGQFPGGGSSFLEVQFYPPGYAPFIDNISCDNTHWCASLHINDLECTVGFTSCNKTCLEPTNFAFIQTNGIPTGPPSPQRANVRTFTPNRHTLFMNPGDRIRTHIFDAAIKGGHALRVRIDDLTTGRSGFMTASAANGYMATSIVDCSGTPFNYEPEYSTATPLHLVPWAALEGGILTQFEIGHFEPCTTVTGRRVFTQNSFRDVFWNNCHGPYETDTVADGAHQNPQTTDAPCYRRGDTHGGVAPPNLVTGCVDINAGGDLDFDGTSYRPDWPSSLTPRRHPSPFLQLQPVTTGGATYPRLQFETDAPASEVTTCSPDHLQGCAVPPPSAPTPFYPWWTHANVGGSCVWEFGQMTNGNTFGRTNQYGAPDLKYFFANLISPVMPNRPC